MSSLLGKLSSWLSAKPKAGAAEERQSAWSLRDPALVHLFGGHQTESGVGVSEATALNISAVWSAIRVISETVASLPLILYRRHDGGRVRAYENNLYSLLHDMPNPETPALVWREAFIAHCLTWGNAYAEIERNEYGFPTALWILPPDRVTIHRDQDGLLYYQYLPMDGKSQFFEPKDIFHLRGLGYDGISGYSVIRTARRSLGLSAAAETFGARLFGHGAKPSGILTVPGALSDDAKQRLRREWDALQSGVHNSHKTAILEQGLQWQATGIPPEDAQFLQTRAFQTEEVARWFNCPPSKLRVSGQSFSSLEQENLFFLSETIRPWLIRFEQAVTEKLLLPAERKSLYAEFLVEGLLRADQQTRYNSYAVGRNWGWLSVNEIRARENLDPIPGGDEYLQPLNMQAINAPSGPSAPSAGPALIPTPFRPAAGTPTAPSPADELTGDDEVNTAPTISEATQRLADQMTEFQIPACEHGSTNRCRICGIERERELVPPVKPGGKYGWKIRWVPIQPEARK